MPNYRVEISPNGRAGCQDSVCKAEKLKIKKGELRLGVWVEYPGSDFAPGWKWRHWGCTSGESIKHIQQALDENGSGEYNWEFLDGWDDIKDDKDIRKKIQGVIKQGHIDPEDFKGDPEFNKPGQKGIRGRAPRKKKNADGDEGDEPTTSQAAPEPDTPKPAAKRGRKKKADDDADDENQPPAKKAKKAVKKEVKDEDSEADTKKTKKTKKAVKKEVKDEDSEADTKKTKKAVKKEVKDEDLEDDAHPIDEIPAAKAKGKRGAAKMAAAVKDESDAEDGSKAPKARPRRGAGKKAAVYKEEEISEDDELREESTPKKAAHKGKAKRGKKAATPEDSDGEPAFEPEEETEEPEEEIEEDELDEPVVEKKQKSRKTSLANGDEAVEAKPQPKKRGRKVMAS